MKERKPLKCRGHMVQDEHGNIAPMTEEDREAISIKAQLEWAELETGHRHELADEDSKSAG